MIDHVMRVTEAAPAVAQVVAVLHDVSERSDWSPGDLGERVPLEADEVRALDLLTEREGEGIVDHTRRVIDAPADHARTLAMAVKRADVADHLQFGDGDTDHRAALELLLAD